MQFVLSFLEGIITFISPCLLPMLPIYVSYFAGGVQKSGEGQQAKTGRVSKALLNSIGFVLGFTIVFVLMGALAGSFGLLIKQNQRVFDIIGGAIVILFGLNFTGLLKIPFLSGTKRLDFKTTKLGFFTSIVFGIVFSIGWTPCVGAFLGSALTLAASGGETINGILMLLCFSMGLGIPFVVSAVLIDKLKTAFNFIKKHYKVINIVSGGLLIITGIMMATGTMGYLLGLLSF